MSFWQGCLVSGSRLVVASLLTRLLYLVRGIFSIDVAIVWFNFSRSGGGAPTS